MILSNKYIDMLENDEKFSIIVKEYIGSSNEVVMNTRQGISRELFTNNELRYLYKAKMAEYILQNYIKNSLPLSEYEKYKTHVFCNNMERVKKDMETLKRKIMITT